MRFLLKSAFSAFVLLTALSNAGKNDYIRATLGSVDCTAELPALGAGHIVLTDSNYKEWRKNNEKLHVIGVADPTCANCCQSEIILSKLQQAFDDKQYTGKKGKKL